MGGARAAGLSTFRWVNATSRPSGYQKSRKCYGEKKEKRFQAEEKRRVEAAGLRSAGDLRRWSATGKMGGRRGMPYSAAHG